MVNIADVAREANVSVATVSRVINSIGIVKPETEYKVHEAIKKLSYVPNLSARNLRKNESRIILILTPNFSNPYYSKVLSGICDISRDLGYSTLIYNTYDSKALDEQLLVKLFRSNRADGMITLACNKDDRWLEKYRGRYAIVQCSEYVEGLEMPHISVDNRKSAHDCVSHLVALGHRRIGIIGSTNKYMSSAMRMKGYCDALEDAGIGCNERFVEYGDAEYSFASGRSAARRLLTQNNPPTALFCISDILALGAVAEAREMGMQVPRDLSVIGFDDVDYTTMFHPMLTTIAVPCYDLGRQSMLLLHKHIQKQPGAETHVYLPHQLVVRESAASRADTTIF